MKRSLLLVGAVIVTFGMGFLAHAQVGEPKLPPGAPSNPNTILSGEDVGFRVESYRGGMPVGTFVVKIDGKWVPVTEATGLKRVTQ